ncbi:MAG: DUF4034 domain-containing protein [Azoarcus sp.]|jgi:hypothetical protein|nr:DUF4034 domain-containing protein [Azoarcus sp.]
MKTSKVVKAAVMALIVESACCVVTVASAQSGQCPLASGGSRYTEHSEASHMIMKGQFQQAEALLEKLHRRNLASSGGDLLTSRGLYRLLTLIPQTGDEVRRWADSQQQSFFAQLVAGIFYVNQAGRARGGKFSSETSRSQFAEMSRLDGVAISYLQKAMRLNPRSALPQSVMIIIGTRENKAAGKDARQWLQAAIQADPSTMAARATATTFLTPRWGWTFELLDQMILQAKESLTAENAHYLEFLMTRGKASHEEVIAKNISGARTLYQRAKEMCVNAADGQEEINRPQRRTDANGRTAR